MHYSNAKRYQTSHEVKATYRNFWGLVIPAGTPCHFVEQGGFHLAASPDYLPDPILREQASKPESMFCHEASHYWAWVSPDDVKEVTA